jgi:hypothetical protein
MAASCHQVGIATGVVVVGELMGAGSEHEAVGEAPLVACSSASASLFPATPDGPSSLDFRDPRRLRDTLHDMRMPPYLRDSDSNPMSLTWRQYRALLGLLERYEGEAGLLETRGAATPSSAPVVKCAESSNRSRRTRTPGRGRTGDRGCARRYPVPGSNSRLRPRAARCRDCN